jgi:chemotaxis protein MotA
MQFKTIAAFILSLGVFIGAAYSSAKNPVIFLNFHAALVVLGGTFAAAAISFGFDRLLVLCKVLYRRILLGRKTFEPRQLIEMIMYYADVYRNTPEQLRLEAQKSPDYFLKEALEMLADNHLEEEDLVRIMMTRTSSTYQRYQEEAIKFRSLAKFPPAFGLMGAVLGMIGIMAELGGDGAMANMGPSLALALVGTLYGVALANVIILPLAENLLESAREIRSKNLMVTEAVHLMMQRKNPVLMAEDLNSFLLPSERVDWREAKEKFQKAS